MRDVQLTEEMKTRLEEFSAVQVEKEFKYVPKIYREKDSTGNYLIPKTLWPVFIIRGLSSVEYMKIGDEMEYTKDDKGKIILKIQSGKTALLTCKYGILDWKKFKTKDDVIISSPKIDTVSGGLDTESLGKLSSRLMWELSNAISEQSKLSEEELTGLEF